MNGLWKLLANVLDDLSDKLFLLATMVGAAAGVAWLICTGNASEYPAVMQALLAIMAGSFSAYLVTIQHSPTSNGNGNGSPKPPEPPV